MLKSFEGFSLFVKIVDKGKIFVELVEYCCFFYCKYYRVFIVGNLNFVFYMYF